MGWGHAAVLSGRWASQFPGAAFKGIGTPLLFSSCTAVPWAGEEPGLWTPGRGLQHACTQACSLHLCAHTLVHVYCSRLHMRTGECTHTCTYIVMHTTAIYSNRVEEKTGYSLAKCISRPAVKTQVSQAVIPFRF